MQVYHIILIRVNDYSRHFNDKLIKPITYKCKNDLCITMSGGSWDDNSSLARAANRSRDSPDSRYGIVGFRVVYVARM